MKAVIDFSYAALVAAVIGFCIRFHCSMLSSESLRSSDSRGSGFTAIQSLRPPPRTS